MRPARVAPPALAALAAALVAGGGALAVAASARGLDWAPADLLGGIACLAFAVVGAAIALRQPRNAIGWIFLALGIDAGLRTLAEYYAIVGLDDGWPLAAQAAAFAFVEWLGGIAITGVVLAAALFPSGRLPSRRFRPLVALFVGCAAGATLLEAVGSATLGEPFDGVANPFYVAGASDLQVLAASAAGAALVLAAASGRSLLRRLRVAQGAERAQLGLFVVAMIVSASLWALGVAWWLLDDREASWLAIGAVALALPGTPVAIGVAILRHRLYVVDPRRLRAVASALVTLALLAVYVTVLLAVSPAEDAVGVLPSLLLAVPVAVLFGPARRRLHRAVEALVVGTVGDPYAPIASLGSTLAASRAAEDVLPDIAATIAGTLRAPFVAVEIDVSGRLRRSVAIGEEPEHVADVPLRYAGERIGRLLVGRDDARAVELSASERQLLAPLAHRVGAVVQNARLAAELREASERVVDARERERHRLRRDLHDGLGPTLASMALQLDVAASGRVELDPVLLAVRRARPERRRRDPPAGAGAAAAGAGRARPGRRDPAAGRVRTRPCRCASRRAPSRSCPPPSRWRPTGSPSRRSTTPRATRRPASAWCA